MSNSSSSMPLGYFEQIGEIELGRGDVISTSDLTNFPGDYPVYSSSAVGDGEFGKYGKYMFDEELITWSIDGGGRPFYRPKHKYSVTNVCGYLRIVRPDLWDYRYLHALLVLKQSRIQFDYQMKAHPSVIRELYHLERLPINEQRKIGEVIGDLVGAIDQTQAIITKLKAVKQGLLHDLLTRGIDANGELRPPHSEAPHLYKPSPLGPIPTEWDCVPLGELADSLIDGPFGSNLKTSHYVEQPGVPVVRLQNIQQGFYDNSQKAYVSKIHAAKLDKNSVLGGDILIASLGEGNFPVGRACMYPHDLPKAINKADCFRFRANSTCINRFIMWYLNSFIAKRQVKGYEQGVTMKRINLGNLKKVKVSAPDVSEQNAISARLDGLDEQIQRNYIHQNKLGQQKIGLMDDLLTGSLKVTPLLDNSPLKRAI